MVMKKNIKHVFAHRDPESIKVAKINEKDEELESPINDELNVVRRDLRKTVITIIVFVAIILAFYFIQIKTDLLKPVLRLFGL
jgi:hypothetical protein